MVATVRLMIRRTSVVVAWGAAGVALAGALIVGAFAVAGTTLTEPATPIRVSAPALTPDPSTSHETDAAGAGSSSSSSDNPTNGSTDHRSGSGSATVSATGTSSDDAGGANGTDTGSGGLEGDD
jgi:hypothetical protein